jgi:hypothetical protein
LQRIVERISKILYEFKIFKLLSQIFYRNQKLRVFLRVLGFETNGYLVSVPKELKAPRINWKKSKNKDLLDFDFGEQDIQVLAKECKEETGFYPISFSFPVKKLQMLAPIYKKRLVSNVVPGDKYSFNSEDDYYRQYLESNLAFTMKKGGWDCYRHLEIMACGAVPIFLNADDIPKNTMVHYPKNFFVEFENHFFKNKSGVSNKTLLAMRDFFNKNLTTKAMAQYILETADVNPNKVLFIDLDLKNYPDYLSVCTLIGLKETFGTRCDAITDPDYIYDDSITNLLNLYGRGFGYSLSVPGSTRSNCSINFENINGDPANLVESISKYDLLILGCFEKNIEIFEFLTKYRLELPPIVVIHGGDRQLNDSERKSLLDSKLTVFVREL